MSTNMAAVHARLDHQISTAPLRERVQRRGPMREDKLTHPAPVNEMEASVRGHGDEIRRLIRRVDSLERRLEELGK